MINQKATLTANGTVLVPVTAGEYIIHIAGVWDTATVVIHWDHGGASTVAYPSSSYTTDAVTRLDIATGKFAFVVSSVGASTLLKVFVAPVVNKSLRIG